MTSDNGLILKGIDRLVRDGRAEHTMIDGKPGIRLIPVPREVGFTKLADEPPASIPEGYRAPFDDRSTLEMMADRDARTEGNPVWQLVDNSNKKTFGYLRILKDGKRVADIFPYGKESDEPFVREQAARIVEQMNKIDMTPSGHR